MNPSSPKRAALLLDTPSVEVVGATTRYGRLQNYFFNPDFISEVCGELRVPWRSNGYRWFLPKE